MLWVANMVGAMRSLLFVARSQVRRRVWGLVALTLVVGVAAGVAASLIAGSRRSATVVDRYFRAGIPFTVGVFRQGGRLTPRTVQALPNVVRVDPESYVGMMHRGSVEGINGLALGPDSLDPTIQLLHGRKLRPGEADASGMVNQAFVKEFGLGVGDDVDVQMFSDADSDNVQAGDYRPTGPSYTFHIVGVFRAPTDIALDEIRGPKTSAAGSNNQMIIPWGWYAAKSPHFLAFGTGYDVQLRDPERDQNAFVAAAQRAGLQTGPGRFSERRDSFNTPVDVETWVLLALGIAVAVVSFVVVTLLLRAEQRAHGTDQPILTALGTTRNERGTVALLRVLPVAVGGSLLAVVVAYGLSGRFRWASGTCSSCTVGGKPTSRCSAKLLWRPS
jgi:hypothetical protein